MRKSPAERVRRAPALGSCRRTLARQCSESISSFSLSFCFFRSANRHTIEVLFGKDLGEEALRTRHREMLVQGVLGMLRPLGDGTGAEGGATP